MRTPPLRCLSILPHLLTQICHLPTSLGSLGPSMKVCLGMLRQSNLALHLCKHLRPHKALLQRGCPSGPTESRCHCQVETRQYRWWAEHLSCPSKPSLATQLPRWWPTRNSSPSHPPLYPTNPSHLHHHQRYHHSDCQNAGTSITHQARSIEL